MISPNVVSFGSFTSFLIFNVIVPVVLITNDLVTFAFCSNLIAPAFESVTFKFSISVVPLRTNVPSKISTTSNVPAPVTVLVPALTVTPLSSTSAFGALIVIFAAFTFLTISFPVSLVSIVNSSTEPTPVAPSKLLKSYSAVCLSVKFLAGVLPSASFLILIPSNLYSLYEPSSNFACKSATDIVFLFGSVWLGSVSFT